MARDYVILVPGFFGFTNFGELKYFGHVPEILQHRLSGRGVDATVMTAWTLPTASLRRRASVLADQIATEVPPGAHVHLIGHSTGGIDARMAVSAANLVDSQYPAESWVDRVRTVTTISAPHWGTPLASLFRGQSGRRLLKLFSIVTMYVLRRGTLPLSIAGRLARLFATVDRGVNLTVIDDLAAQLLDNLAPERRQRIQTFLESVSAEQGLLPELTPPAMAELTRRIPDRATVKYGSVLTRGPAPRIRGQLRAGLDPYAHATRLVYATLHRASGLRRPLPDGTNEVTLWHHFGHVPEPGWTDGIVPTLAQPWGDVLAVAQADHLDVLGHFAAPRHAPPHYDWLSSGSGFNRHAFEQVWDRVAAFIASAPIERRS